MIEYEDFSLKIEPKRGDVYPVIVLRSPAGEGRSSFTLPFNPNEIGDILFDLGRTVRSGGQVPRRDVSPTATRTRPQQIGDQLFNALFSGPTRSLLDRSLGMIHGQQLGLRIKLHIDPEDPSLAQLSSLPWEFLYRKETRDFLNLSRFTPILRYLDVQRPDTPLPLEPPLRILVIISDPADYPRLDLDRERGLIEASWARQEGVQVDFMEMASILALQDRLAEQPYHVLHYMGHGGIDEPTGRGVLVMEDKDGLGAIVDGNSLGILLRDISTMRLAFLNACDTARVTKEKGLDPFAGVAAAMVMAGVPAVVAMQFPVSDNAAITFSQKFYPLLARGEPVDAAVAEGRRAICLAETGTMEWGTPVLFLRAPQGVIFQVSKVQGEKVPAPHIPEIQEEIDEELELQIADLYTRGLSAFWLENWEKAARNFQAIVDTRPEYEDAAEKLAEAKRQANLHSLYGQAQEAHEEENWAIALVALEQLAAEAADFKDIKERLKTVRKQKQLADLYAEAQHLQQAQQWQAVVNVFGQIHTIEPDYPDPEGLLHIAEREASEQKRQEQLNALYSQAVREMDASHWQEAKHSLVQVQEMELSFRETENLLTRVDKEIEREEAERERQEQISTSHEQALGLAQAGQWRQVLTMMDKIQALDPDFEDLEGLATKAREEVTKEEEEARRQSELAALYAEAVRLMKAGKYQEALEKWGEVRERDPAYKDREKVEATAKENLDALAKGIPLRRKMPRWVIAAIGGIVILTGIFIIIFGGSTISRIMSGGGDEGLPVAAVSTTTEEDQVIVLGSPSQTSTAVKTKTPVLLTATALASEASTTSDVSSISGYYDDFDDPEYENHLDESKWDAEGPSDCQIKQKDGILVIDSSSKTLSDDLDCYLFVKGDEVLGNNLDYFDAEVKLDDDYGQDLNSLGLMLGWGIDWFQCAMMANNGSVEASVGNSEDDAEIIGSISDLDLHSWNKLRIEIDPDFMSFSCYFNDLLVGSVVPNLDANLSDLAFIRYLQLDTSSETWARFFVDNVRLSPLVTPTTPVTPTINLPSPVFRVLSNVEVLYHDDFDQLLSSEWIYDSNYVRATGGQVEIAGPVGSTGFFSQRILQEGEGVLILFKYDDPDANLNFKLLNGQWGTPNFRELNLCQCYGDFELWIEKGTAGPDKHPLIGNLAPRPDTWYYILLAVEKNGKLVAQVWEQDDPSQISGYRQSPDDDWVDVDWWFGVAPGEDGDKVYIDSFTEISFSWYDDFDDPTYDGSLDDSKWYVQGVNCPLSQDDRNLLFDNSSTTESEISGCFFKTNTWRFGEYLDLFEVDVKIDEQSDEGFALGLVHSSDIGWISCQITSGEDYSPNVNLTVGNGGLKSFGSIEDVNLALWNTLRVEIEPDTMTFSCYFNDEKVGSTVPNLGHDLRKVEFERYLQYYFDPESWAKIRVDNVRLVP